MTRSSIRTGTLVIVTVAAATIGGGSRPCVTAAESTLRAPARLSETGLYLRDDAAIERMRQWIARDLATRPAHQP